MAKKENLQGICKVMFQQIHTTWGNGWKLLGDDLKRAIIAERVIHLFAGRDEEARITPDMISEYFNAMKHYCGLDTDVDA